ncbi:hypothetical protein J5J86_16490 [Aquabacter sp. L1I39]|uniref:hypothetical protein n=1 Tax=Aquabacter sp. L1I39 TaxID=2820278 RepID=UPI001ADD03CA|nr:hypothetical protein [Aquabacter sp. L1I39]QTL02384.1 hypothetical protein J5J86_16490 [Aquabacter sp. L1I39]
MKRLVVACCGAAALGIVSLAGQAQAMPLTPATPAAPAAQPLGMARGGVSAEQVAWRRVCRPVRTWWNGRPVVVQRCNRVWVGPPRGYGYGPRPAPRYGNYYAPPPRRFY